MSSTRLPGKVLKEIDGEPLIKIMTDRLKGFDIAVITSGSPKDDILVDWCKNNKVKYFRGSDRDVLDRYYRAAKYFGADLIGRLCSDCPLIDPMLISEALSKIEDYDFIGNYGRDSENWYPDGMDIEIFSMDALERTWMNAGTKYEREHVTPWAWNNLYARKMYPDKDYSNTRLTVDTQEDFDRIKRIYRNLKKKGDFGYWYEY